jgi:hypothetical protein
MQVLQPRSAQGALPLHAALRAQQGGHHLQVAGVGGGQQTVARLQKRLPALRAVALSRERVQKLHQ